VTHTVAGYKYALQLAIASGTVWLITGCVSPIALHHAVLAYDRTVEQVTSEQLLLNIVRARFYQPLHFTKVSSVAATFDFRVSAGIAPPEGDARGLVGPMFSATAAENPTITIVPIDGEEFTSRLLTPLDETRFLKLLEVGENMGMALQMAVSSMRIQRGDKTDVYLNHPGCPDEYEEFQRRVRHLTALYDEHQLHIGAVMSEEVWTGPVPVGIAPRDVLAALNKGYKWKATKHKFRLDRMRVLISNYRPHEVDESVRQALGERLKEWPANEILLDIRPNFPGGEFPIQGQLTLRSFNSVLEFFARGMREAHHQPNAVHLLTIEESEKALKDAAVSVRYEGRYYAIRKPTPERPTDIRNAKAFDMLYQLFQMMVQPVNAAVPAITISK
jgi:hypothetical protein